MLVNFSVFYDGRSAQTDTDIEKLVGYEAIASGHFLATDERSIEFEIPEADWPRVQKELERSPFDYTLENLEVDMPKPKVKTHEPAPAEKGDAYEGPVTAPANEQPPKADLTHEPIGDGEHKPRSTISGA
jgi:hypothetical protein